MDNKEKKVTLNYTGSYFASKYFRVEETNGTDVLVFTFTRGDRKKHSVNFIVFNRDKTVTFNTGDSIRASEGKYYLGAQNYILAEKGTHGLDFEVKVFNCSVNKADDGFTAQITQSDDESLCNELWEIAVNTIDLNGDLFGQGIYNATIPRNGCNLEAEAKLDDFLKVLKETDFLDIDSDDENRRYISLSCLDDYSGGISGLRTERRNVQVLPPNGKGVFIPYQNGCCKAVSNIEALLVKDPCAKGCFAVLKPVKLLHDIEADIWLETEVEYRYPQDASAIANAYPALYREVTKKEEPWRAIPPFGNGEDLSSYSLGDMQMYIPCEYVRQRWCVKKDLFHFTSRSENAQPYYGLNKEYLLLDGIDGCERDDDYYAVAFVNYSGAEYFAVYGLSERKRLKTDVYIKCTFRKFAPLSEFLAGAKSDDENYSVLYWSYRYHFRYNGLISSPISAEIFDKLYTAYAQ